MLIMKMMNRVPDMRPSYREVITSLEVYMKHSVRGASSMRRFASGIRKSVPPASPGVQRTSVSIQTELPAPGSPDAQEPLKTSAFQRFLYHPLVILTVSVLLLLVILIVAFLLFAGEAGKENAMIRAEGIRIEVHS